VCGYWIATARHTRYSYVVAVVALGLSMYVPGLIWFLILAAFVRRKDIVLLGLRLSIKLRILLFLMLIALVITPLAFSIVRNPQIGLQLLGLPTELPEVLAVLKNIVHIPLNIFIRSSGNPEIHLGHLPLLDVFTGIMCLLGIYFYFVHRTLDRAKLLVVFFIIGGILIGIGGPVHEAILLPAVYIVATGGIALLLNQWLEVFPENPVAKTTGIIFITVAVLLSCLYNLRSYFIAWPNNDETRAVYSKSNTDLVQ
jgi:hypothetical protein